MDFLKANDLDHLIALGEKLKPTTEQNQELIRQTLQYRTDIQAVANLLMYPKLIPEAQRYRAILEGMRDRENSYLVLAAVVGLLDLSSSSFSTPLGKEIIKEVILVLHSHHEVIAERASLFLAERLWRIDYTILPEVIGLLDYPSEIVRHNTIVALIPLVGITNLRKVMSEAVEQGRVSKKAQLETEKKLCTIIGFYQDDSVEESEFDLGMLGTPLLAYIPNYQEWEN